MNDFLSRYNGKIYSNPVATDVMQPGAFFRVLKKYFQKHPDREPNPSIGPFQADVHLLNNLPSNTLRATWLGHSTVIIEIDSKRFLTDPVWYKRVSPFSMLGPKRFFQNPILIDDLPPIDYILLSHDHYDHLDKGTLLQLTAKNIPVITMSGVGNHLKKWRVDKSMITEMDWWQEVTLPGGFTITAAPARHFSGRWINDRFHTLWGSFAIKGPVHNVYFGADSGYYEGFATIGEKLGPFDLTMLDSGAYNEEWSSIHMGPENAVKAHIDLKGKMLLPIHWGTFSLAFHAWTEPVERVIKASQDKGVQLLLPAPGQTYNLADGAYNSEWWRK